MNVWLELHVDDELLVRHPDAWPEAAALVDQVSRAAEGEGGRLSVRFRAPFVRGDREGFVRALAARGHEVGAHAHARDLDAVAQAFAAAGLPLGVTAPGLVQARRGQEERLLARAAALGAAGFTDRVEARRWTYQGWLPRRSAAGPWLLDVSVSPWSWGVVRRGPGGPVSAQGALDWPALDRMAAVQAGWAPPPGCVPFFGATFHEHDLCPANRFVPAAGALDGLRRWVARWRPRPSAEAAVGASLDAGGFGAPDGSAVRRALRPVAAAARRAWGTESAGPLPPHVRIGPRDADLLVVAVHAGEGGLVERLRFLGLPDGGFGPTVAVWLYARREAGWPAPGNPAHIDDARAVLRAALAEGRPTVVLGYSGGVVAAAAALLAEAADPRTARQVRALVDVEAPVDRHSLQKPGAEAEWAAMSVYDEEPWAGRELVALLPALASRLPALRYRRWQAEVDHVHGGCTLHAARALDAARRAGLDAAEVRVRGRLRDGATVWSAALFAAAEVAVPDGIG